MLSLIVFVTHLRVNHRIFTTDGRHRKMMPMAEVGWRFAWRKIYLTKSNPLAFTAHRFIANLIFDLLQISQRICFPFGLVALVDLGSPLFRWSWYTWIRLLTKWIRILFNKFDWILCVIKWCIIDCISLRIKSWKKKNNQQKLRNE